MAKSKSNQLPLNHYRVLLTYSIPSIEEIEKEWGEDGVSVYFDGRPFRLHASCLGMDRTPGERIFYVHDAGGDWETEGEIAWGLEQRNALAPNGYRPATHEETYEFAKAHPELLNYVGLGSFRLLRDDQVVLGSLAEYGDDRCFASVWNRQGRRYLGVIYDIRGVGWSRTGRVLFVSI